MHDRWPGDDCDICPAPAEPPATDDLVRDLNDWVRTFAYDAPLRRCIERGADTIVALRVVVERQAREIAEYRDLRDVLLRNGFVPCDIPACNCGSWHARYGLPERWDEQKDDLSDAGHPLCNANGNNLRKALAGLVAERDALREVVTAADAMRNEAWSWPSMKVIGLYDAARAKVGDKC